MTDKSSIFTFIVILTVILTYGMRVIVPHMAEKFYLCHSNPSQKEE